MSAVELEIPIRHWHCPACNLRDVTQKAEVHTQFHNCPANANLGLPLVEVQNPTVIADARHVPQIGESGELTSIGTEHSSGRIDRTVFL